MKSYAWFLGFCCVTGALSGAESALLMASTASFPMAGNQNLTDALAALGVLPSDIMALQETGKASAPLINAVNGYAQYSNNAVFNNLTQPQRNALVLFSYNLFNKNELSAKNIENLMRDEKIRVGMSEAQITQFNELVDHVTKNSSYQLTPEMIGQIQETMPFIQDDPFAFADGIGPLIGALIYNSEHGFIEPDSSLENSLIIAAQSLTGLTDEQVTNITNITDVYQENGSFEDSDENVNDMNQALAVAALPLGAFALYPLIGYGGAWEVNEITRAYPHYFNQAEVEHWNHVEQRQGYYNETSAQHQEYVNQRQSEYNSAAGQHEENTNQRQSGRNEAAGPREENRAQRQNGAAQRQEGGAGARAQRQNGAAQRREGRAGANASGQRGTSLNRDYNRGGSRASGGGHGGGGRR